MSASGHDDVFDLWYPLVPPICSVLHMGPYVCQLMGYGQINDGLKPITEYSARTLNLQDYGVAGRQTRQSADPAGGKRV